ncbi:hypothetical protein GALMADRAFT_160399 [Galerina marginata CBS 339.88]|uniref:Uncharacterized protein n=1 Tax=Galerina marginata (strain CBS 339.88) TaxID=685588 RepID=A0A067SI23_GALM3|nr:hypothetical protein GALMADRAFT_160399 [Galerina marginata CBS 339.88]
MPSISDKTTTPTFNPHDDDRGNVATLRFSIFTGWPAPLAWNRLHTRVPFLLSSHCPAHGQRANERDALDTKLSQGHTKAVALVVELEIRRSGPPSLPSLIPFRAPLAPFRPTAGSRYPSQALPGCPCPGDGAGGWRSSAPRWVAAVLFKFSTQEGGKGCRLSGLQLPPPYLPPTTRPGFLETGTSTSEPAVKSLATTSTSTIKIQTLNSKLDLKSWSETGGGGGCIIMRVSRRLALELEPGCVKFLSPHPTPCPLLPLRLPSPSPPPLARITPASLASSLSHRIAVPLPPETRTRTGTDCQPEVSSRNSTSNVGLRVQALSIRATLSRAVRPVNQEEEQQEEQEEAQAQQQQQEEEEEEEGRRRGEEEGADSTSPTNAVTSIPPRPPHPAYTASACDASRHQQGPCSKSPTNTVTTAPAPLLPLHLLIFSSSFRVVPRLRVLAMRVGTET